ncbi:MAG: UDP-N-acetylmuramoyl-L-alanine--D-glutamate ligase [Coriobacteriia bacterium]|nr:UDP-N-acetylmuramoyl-L-alanine--D-glutamate ligase [Coriobacteriia bacterium]
MAAAATAARGAPAAAAAVAPVSAATAPPVPAGDILVIGLGESGRAVAEYVLGKTDGRFGSVTIVDAADTPTLREAAKKLVALGARVFLGRSRIDAGVVGASEAEGALEATDALEADNMFEGTGVREADNTFDLCVASPGIPPHSDLAGWASGVSARMISEIEFAYLESLQAGSPQAESSEAGSPQAGSSQAWIAVTGTNGKTTTTALIAHLFRAGDVLARAVGNIGEPAISAVAAAGAAGAAEAAGADVVLVAEISSFQLALTEAFHPRVAVLLNITPDHIDWHGSMAGYMRDKARVFENLTSADCAILNVDDDLTRSLLPTVAKTGARVIRVSATPGTEAEGFVENGRLTLTTANGERFALAGAEELQVKGRHNITNALAAAAAGFSFGLSPEALRRGLTSFEPIEHRLEPVGSAAGAEWFNDSKATNPDAVRKALDAFGDRPLIVLLGGRNKDNDFSLLATDVARRVRVAVLFGESAAELAEAFDACDGGGVGAGADDRLTVFNADTLAEAVGLAAKAAVPGDAVVLSPACASFDEFRNYEERGRVFKALVKEVAAKGERR